MKSGLFYVVLSSKLGPVKFVLLKKVSLTWVRPHSSMMMTGKYSILVLWPWTIQPFFGAVVMIVW